jgi:hypothetical protein
MLFSRSPFTNQIINKVPITPESCNYRVIIRDDGPTIIIEEVVSLLVRAFGPVIRLTGVNEK